MEINNFNKISHYLQFNNDDEFYFLQILKRKKDGNAVKGANKNRLIKYYIIKSVKQFNDLEEEIIKVCKIFNARAYIHPTKRSFKEVNKVYLRNVVDNYASENHKTLGREFSTACGKSYITSDKKFIIDIDEPATKELLNSLNELLNNCEPLNTEKWLYSIDTKNGFHLICSPFNTRKFVQDHLIKFGTRIDIHKNNPTLLYHYDDKS